MDNVIRVQMLGGFSVTYDGKPVSLERNSITKATQLLQYLVSNAETPIARDQLISILYGDNDVLNPQNNLKVSVFRLRKLLKASHLPECEYIQQQSGMYMWHSDVSVEVDAKVFAKTAHEAVDFRRDSNERLKLLNSAISLYRGDFLPMLASEQWVSTESVRYHNMYTTCVLGAYELMEAKGDYESALDVVSRAVKIYPYDEGLHLKRISALIALRRYQDALVAYDNAAKRFLEDLGISPSAEMLELYEQITGDTLSSAALITEVKATLKEGNPAPGAYYCNFPGFIDSYRYVSRLVQRNGQSIFLMLSTLTDTQGIPLELGDRLSTAAEMLHSVVFQSLRKSDLYTRYSPCQFLILLMGISEESCRLVSDRISRLFKEQCTVRGVRLTHSVTSGIDVDMPNVETKFSGGLSFF